MLLSPQVLYRIVFVATQQATAKTLCATSTTSNRQDKCATGIINNQHLIPFQFQVAGSQKRNIIRFAPHVLHRIVFVDAQYTTVKTLCAIGTESNCQSKCTAGKEVVYFSAYYLDSEIKNKNVSQTFLTLYFKSDLGRTLADHF